MKEFVISEAQTEKAVLVGLITKTQDERKTQEYLDELAFLAETAGAEVVKSFTQKIDQANTVTYVGKGKLQEIKEYIRAHEDNVEEEVGMVIFDDELSAKQIRNIEAELKVKILDRTSLILDIFAMRAQTANAKTQVELAQNKYMLPRLQRLWTHLERQGGGSGSGKGGSVGLRGPGETQLEMDRPSGPMRGYGGRRHWTPRPSRNRRTDGSSTDASRTSSNRDRAGRVPRPRRS